MNRLFIFLAALCFAGASAGHTDDWFDSHPSAHGGQTRMAGPLHIELVREERPVVYLTDHASRPLSTVGARGRLVTGHGKHHPEVELLPEGDSALRAVSPFPLQADEAVRVFVDRQGFATEWARFAPVSASDHAEHAPDTHH